MHWKKKVWIETGHRLIPVVRTHWWKKGVLSFCGCLGGNDGDGHGEAGLSLT